MSISRVEGESQCKHLMLYHLADPLCEKYSGCEKAATIALVILLNVITLGVPLLYYIPYAAYKLLIKPCCTNPETIKSNVSVQQHIIPLAVESLKAKPPAQEALPSLLMERIAFYAKKHATETAACYRGEELTYESLFAQVERTAANLIEVHQLRPGDRVAVVESNKMHCLIAELAALRAGAIFVPIDANCPPETLREILEDSKASLIVSSSLPFNEYSLPMVSPSALFEENKTGPLFEFPEVANEEPAYILYTSGSTQGRAKGVVQTRGGLLGQIKNYTRDLEITSEDRFLQLATMSHDQAIVDTFGALLNGSSIFFYDFGGEQINPQEIRRAIRDDRITIYSSIPSVLPMIFDAPESEEEYPSLRIVTIGGEATKKEHVSLFQRFAPENALLVNGYGATECSWVSSFSVGKRDPIDSLPAMLPLGYLTSGTEAIVVPMDEEDSDDGRGELCISSRSMCAGYTVTADSEAAFVTIEGKCYYKTGDIVRMEEVDGRELFHFVGRRSWHHKINGHRVNIAYVEEKLRELLPEIAEVAVIPQSAERLYALCIMKDGQKAIDPNFRERLKDHLKEFELPFKFIECEGVSLPALRNGKLDRNRCSEIVQEAVNAQIEINDAVSEELHPVIQIILDWVLFDPSDLPKEDSLTSLGITSLQILPILNAINARIPAQSAQIHTRDLYGNNVASLIKLFDSRVKQVELPIEKLEGEEALPVASNRQTCLASTHHFMVSSNIGDSALLQSYKIEYLFDSYNHIPGIEDFVKYILKKVDKDYEFLRTRFSFKEKLVTPSIEKVSEIADHYRQKYEIEIQLCLLKDLPLSLQRLDSSKVNQPFGVIVYPEKESFGHVTPLLIDCTAGELTVLILDVAGLHRHSNEIKKILVEKKINYLQSGVYRISNPSGCLTDSLVILRNALLHLKHLGKDYRGLDALVGKTSYDVHEVNKLPLEWTYTDEVTDSEDNQKQESIVIRDLHSKKPERHEHPRTMQEFRKLYTEDLEKTYEILPNYRYPGPDYFKFVERARSVAAAHPQDFGFAESSYSLTFKELVECNTYLRKKAWKQKRDFDEDDVASTFE